MYLITSGFNPSPISLSSEDSPSTLPLLAQALRRDGEHVILGDFNLHHPMWNNQGRFSYHRMADQLIEITQDKDMTLGLPKHSVTWNARGQESIIDLVFLTPEAYQAMVRCEPREDLGQGSDHIPIVTELEWHWQELPTVKRRLWKKLEEEETAKQVELGANALDRHLRGLSTQTKTDIDIYVETLNKGLQEIIEECIPWADPRGISKSYWNADCSRATKTAKLSLKAHHRIRDEQSAEELRLAERIKVKTIRKARTLHWRERVHKASLRKEGVWKLARWGREESSKPRGLPQFPAIKDDKGERQSSFEGKVEALRRVLFPSTPAADLEDIAGSRYPDPVPMIREIDKHEVIKAVRHPAADKAPGISGVPNRLLRHVVSPMALSITKLFQACFDLGYHPEHFKKANTIVLKKPNKPDYSEPKAYRPIALLDTLGKALETVISGRLTALAEKYNLLPQQQMGARKGRSVETALETITDAVHTVWSCGGSKRSTVASLLSLDVAGAFDNVSHERLLHNLRERRVPEEIVRWTASFLTDRATSITLGGRTSPIKDVATGIPQGSPISPVLFLFFNAPLIEQCAKACLPVQIEGFVDDIHLLAYGRTTEDNCRVLGKAHEICLRWARIHGASFAPQKYELIHLTRRPKRFNMRASLNVGVTSIHPSVSIRVLGLHVDTKLR